MSLATFGITQPGQVLGAGDELALHIPEFTGVVAETIERKAKVAPFIEVRPVVGTSTITNEGIGESTLSVLTPGTTPDQNSENQFNKIALTVDTVVLARTNVPMLDAFQKQYDVRSKIAREHAKKISKLYDQSFLIQAAKAAALSSSAYGALPGHTGGSTVTLGSSGDQYDPAVMYSAISDLFAAMELKDVDPSVDNVMLALRPDVFYALADAEQLVNGNYVTSKGTVLENVKILKAFGVPVISSNNVPNTNITNHLLSNTRNSNAYNGDFTKLVAVALAPDALLAGETIPLQSKVWFDDLSKTWVIDAWLAYGVTPNVAAYAGRIILP